MNIEFSIIVPTYNSQKFLKETLGSIRSQKVVFECYVMDNLSSDNTRLIVREFETHGFHVISENDSGQANAINKGLKNVKCEIINWLNADDYYEPDALQKVANSFRVGINGVSGRSRIFDENGTKYYSRGTDIYPGNLPKTLGWARIDQPETFFRRSVWDVVGPLNEDLHYVFDREWWIRYLFHYGSEGFKKMDNVLVNFRHHPDSKTIKSFEKFKSEERLVYAAYAKKVRYYDMEEFLLNSKDCDSKIQLDIPASASPVLIKAMLHYYLLKVGNQYYANDKPKSASAFMDKLDAKFLQKEDRYLLNKLKFRNKFPRKIINLFR